MERQKKIAVVNDFSGVGRCSMTVALPILSAMGLQCCCVPTAIFSNHTEYESFYRVDFTPHLPAYFAEWEKRGLMFDGILIGFLGAKAQLEQVLDFLRRFRTAETLVILDPAMGDGGALYPGYPPALAEGMHALAVRADVLLPNWTEACILAGRPYSNAPDLAQMTELAAHLTALGARRVAISGLEIGAELGNFLAADGQTELICTPRTGKTRCGTGDVFSSIVAGGLLRGMTLREAVRLAARFIGKAIAYTEAQRTPPLDGVCFEPFLKDLTE